MNRSKIFAAFLAVCLSCLAVSAQSQTGTTAFEHLENSRSLLGQEKFEQAVAEINKAIKLAESPSYYEHRGRVYSKWGKFDLAVADYTKVINEGMGTGEVFATRAAAYAGMNKPALALADHNQAIKVEESAGDMGSPGRAYIWRGEFHSSQKNYDLALADLNRGIKLEADARARGGILEGEPEDDEAYSIRAEVFYRLKRYDEAVRDYTKAIAIEPRRPHYSERAWMYRQLKQYDKAIADYDKLISIDPKDGVSYGNRGVTRLTMGDAAAALRDIDTAIAMVGENKLLANLYIHRSRALCKLGKKSEATDSERKAQGLGGTIETPCK